MKTRLGSGVEFEITRHAVAGRRFRVRVVATAPTAATEPITLNGRIVGDRDEPSHRRNHRARERKRIKLRGERGSYFIAPFQRLTFVDRIPRRRTRSHP